VACCGSSTAFTKIRRASAAASHLAVHIRRRGRHDPPRIIEIRWLECLPTDREARALFESPETISGEHDRDARTLRDQRLQLPCLQPDHPPTKHTGDRTASGRPDT
jgi:hypothetical protein